MASKEELADMLVQGIDIEENLLIVLAMDELDDIYRNDLSPTEIAEARQLLRRLLFDSLGHQKALTDTLLKVTRSDRKEY